jgi:hypothetical protein
MQLVRTTLRLKRDLKKLAEYKALETDTSLQEIFNRALEEYLKKDMKKEAQRRIRFKTHDLGRPLDKLTRADYYDQPPTKSAR